MEIWVFFKYGNIEMFFTFIYLCVYMNTNGLTCYCFWKIFGYRKQDPIFSWHLVSCVTYFHYFKNTGFLSEWWWDQYFKDILITCFVWISVTCESSSLYVDSQKTYVILISFQLDDGIFDDLSSVFSRQTFSAAKKPDEPNCRKKKQNPTIFNRVFFS